MTDHPESGENYPPNNFEVRQRDIPTIRVRNQMFFNQQPYINKPLANNNNTPYGKNSTSGISSTNNYAKLDDPNNNFFNFDSSLNPASVFNPVDNKNVRTSFVNPQIDSMAQYYSQKPGGGSVGQGVMGPTNSQYLYQQGTKENTVGGLKSKNASSESYPQNQAHQQTATHQQQQQQQPQQQFRPYTNSVSTGYENIMNPLIQKNVNSDRNFYGAGANATTPYSTYGYNTQRKSSLQFDQSNDFAHDNKNYRQQLPIEGHSLPAGSQNNSINSSNNNLIFKDGMYTTSEQLNPEYFDSSQFNPQNLKPYIEASGLPLATARYNDEVGLGKRTSTLSNEAVQAMAQKNGPLDVARHSKSQSVPGKIDSFNRVGVTDRELQPQKDPNESSSPKLGATSIDKLMLIIEARQKGFMGQVPTTQDGDLLIDDDASKSILLPNAAQLVGGVPKPEGRYTKHIKKPEDSNNPDKPAKPRKKRPKVKKYQCAYCSKMFSQSTHLDVHIKAHMGYKPFECEFCGKRFTQASNLRTHRRLHTGERPFKCDKCDKTFARRGNLTAHEFTHESIKPYICRLDNCFKRFSQLGNMKSHQNKYHPQTIKELTQKLALLDPDPTKNNISQNEMELLSYFASLYKYSNKGIKGRGKSSN